MVDTYFESIENEDFENDREKLVKFKQEIKDTFYKNLDDFHIEFIDKFCTDNIVSGKEISAIKGVFDFIKSKV